MKRLILGIGGAIMFCSTAFAGEPIEVGMPQQKILASPGGRYVFGQISDHRKDQFLLDTKTGRLWLVVSGDNQYPKLTPVPFVQLLGHEAYIPDSQEDIEAHRKVGRQQMIEQSKKDPIGIK